jgi:hypothetical protein
VRDLNEEVLPILSLKYLQATPIPEKKMVTLAFWPGVAAVALAMAIGSLSVSPVVGASAGLGIAVVVANYMAAGLSVGWAAGVSFAAFQVVTLAGFAVRMAAVIAALYFISHISWVSDRALELGAAPALILYVTAESLLVFKTRMGKPNLRLDGAGRSPSGVVR